MFSSDAIRRYLHLFCKDLEHLLRTQHSPGLSFHFKGLSASAVLISSCQITGGAKRRVNCLQWRMSMVAAISDPQTWQLEISGWLTWERFNEGLKKLSGAESLDRQESFAWTHLPWNVLRQTACRISQTDVYKTCIDQYQRTHWILLLTQHLSRRSY